MPVENAEIARIMEEIADLLEISEDNPFRVRAYRAAARTVLEEPRSVASLVETDPGALTDLPGIGEDLAGKIIGIARTGSLPLLRQLGRKVPRGVAALMRLPGIGPKRARLLHSALHLRGIEDLERALRTGKVRTLRGFGPGIEARLREELGRLHGLPGRILRATAAQYAATSIAHLRGLPGVRKVEVAGSFRRRMETVGDLDVLVTCGPGIPVVGRFLTLPGIERVLARGPTRAAVRLRSGLQIDLRVLPEASYGSGLYYFTGSKAHNIALRKMAQAAGLKINEYGVFKGRKRIAGRTEQDVLAAVGLPFIPPELREERGELEAAREGRLPRLVSVEDIRGDLQCHTTDSDGRDDLEAMADAAQALGLEYLAITDHSPAVRIAGGMDAAGFRRQIRRIARWNSSHRGLTLLTAAEVDIHPDGRLDLGAGLLADLDVVVVALHSRLGLPVREQTQRVLRALDHPSVDVLAHPTGRLIGRRPPAMLDWDQVFQAARERGILLEVNAQPQRLDLDDHLVRSALGHGLRIVVSTDAHAVAELGFMRWGVDQARRGWAEAKDVANTLPLARFRALLHQARGG